MWIRSQDKKQMMKVESIEIEGNVSKECYILTESQNCMRDIGLYESEERALEVMNYIQNKIAKGDKVYSMPEK